MSGFYSLYPPISMMMAISMTIPATKVPGFKVRKELKEAVK